MKLLLTSNGFVTPEIISKCEELAGKPKSELNVAVINEAYAVEHDDHRWIARAAFPNVCMWASERALLDELFREILDHGPAKAHLQIALD